MLLMYDRNMREVDRMTASETRKLHREAQRAKEQERKRQVEAIKRGCVEVLEADSTTPAQKLEASRLLAEMIKERW